MTETPSTSTPPADGPAQPLGTAQPLGSAATRSAEHRRKSLSTRPRDMVISMAVIVGFVVLLLLLVPRPSEVPVRDINVASAVLGAQNQLGFDPASPDLPEGWTASAAGVQRGATDGVKAWQLTYTTPTGTYAGVQQAKAATSAWESRQVTDGKEAGTEAIGGLEWIVRSRDDRGITSYVYRAGDITTIVTGTADQTEMAQFATAVAADLK